MLWSFAFLLVWWKLRGIFYCNLNFLVTLKPSILSYTCWIFGLPLLWIVQLYHFLIWKIIASPNFFYIVFAEQAFLFWCSKIHCFFYIIVCDVLVMVTRRYSKILEILFYTLLLLTFSSTFLILITLEFTCGYEKVWIQIYFPHVLSECSQSSY